MTCYAPITAYKAAVLNETGKRSMVFKAVGSFSGVAYKLPCGACPGCKLERARVWSVRCMHEKRMHKMSDFITLTYSNDKLPEFGTLVPRHLQLFHKRLHMAVKRANPASVGIRYFGCGEYGGITHRPHYHTLVFGFSFPDRKLYGRNGRGEPIYSSDLANEMWGYGDVKIGDVTFESAGYVARYSLKKASKDERASGAYVVYDADGRIFERAPEFPVMSRRPGIGTPYWLKYGHEIMAHDTIVIEGREVPSVRYYDLKIEALDPDRLKVIKRNRRRKSVFAERSKDRLRVKEILLLKAQKQKGRGL